MIPSQSAGGVFQQLLNLGYLDLPMDDQQKEKRASGFGSLRDSQLVFGDTPVHAIVSFAKKVLSAKLLEVDSCLYAIHGKAKSELCDDPEFHRD